MKQAVVFFFKEFHSGPANVFLHCLGFALLGYGVGVGSLRFLTLAALVMEAGHFYNALRGRYALYALVVVPFQWALWILFILVGFYLERLVFA